MTQRITDAHLNAKIARLNRARGFDAEPKYATIGQAHLMGSYGGVDVGFWCNEHGAVSPGMHKFGTKRELATFLDGMLKALEMAKDGA